MALPEHELERIGILASRVLDGEATDAECADLARLRSEFPEVRELCADLEAGQAALDAGIGSAPLPDGFAQQLSFRAMREAPAPAVSAWRVGAYWGAAAAGIAAAGLLWWSLAGSDDGGRDATPRDTARDRERVAQPGERERTPAPKHDGGISSLFPTRAQPAQPAPEGPAVPAPKERPAPEPPAAPERPTVVETPTLPKAGPSTPPDVAPQPELPPAETPTPASAVVVAGFDQFDGRALAIRPPEGAEWETVGADDLESAQITAGATVRASEGQVSLALQQGGYAALDRGAEVSFQPTDSPDRLRLRVGTGRVFFDLDERSGGMTAETGVATVQLEPGSRVALDVSGAETGVTVLDGHAVVTGTREGDEPKRVGRHAGLKVNRLGRSGSVGKRAPRLRTHERRFLERRFQRHGAELFGQTSRWGGSATLIERRARDLMAGGATPQDLMPLLQGAQKMGYDGEEAVLMLRAFEAAQKQGLSRELARHGLRRVLMQKHRGRAFEAALAHWLQDPESAGRPGHPGKAGSGREGRHPGKGDKPRKPGKAGKPGKKKGMAGPGRR